MRAGKAFVTRTFCANLLIHRNMKYTVILEREPDGGFVASVPVLPGCISQGDTREEAIANMKEAIDLYVEDCLAAGDPVPEEDSREFVELRTGTR
jgi:predicted RNase H-like HicB family nuclease